MRFVWYWTFWHWSKESSRSGFLLRSLLQGIGSHWDEWFRHEASENDLRVIEEIGRSETDQRRFIAWLLVHWAREAGVPRNRQALRFVLGQLAQVRPFNRWTAFEKYRASYGSHGISAVVLAQGSAGEPQDVRLVEALALPFDPTAPAIVAEGFQADSIDLETPRRAAADILGGKGLIVLIASWLAGGKRPYPLWLKIVLASGWLVVGGLILYLAEGPEPGGSLFLLSAILTGLWSALALVAIVSGGSLAFRAWREGKRLRAQLDQSQIRLRMDGGLTLKGGSAGVAFCLNTLLALYRTDTRTAHHSWLWQRLFRELNGDAGTWAATGVITTDGSLKSVVLEPKLSACLQRKSIKHILTPRQTGTGWQGGRAARQFFGLVTPGNGRVKFAGSRRGTSGLRRRGRILARSPLSSCYAGIDAPGRTCQPVPARAEYFCRRHQHPDGARRARPQGHPLAAARTGGGGSIRPGAKLSLGKSEHKTSGGLSGGLGICILV
jgi:hypothetical protein